MRSSLAVDRPPACCAPAGSFAATLSFAPTAMERVTGWETQPREYPCSGKINEDAHAPGALTCRGTTNLVCHRFAATAL